MTKATCSFETSETTCTATKCHMPDDKNPQIYGFRAILSHCHISHIGYVSFRWLSPFTAISLTCMRAALSTERAWLSLKAALIFIFFSWDFWLLFPVGNVFQSGSIQPVETRLCRTIQLGEVTSEDQDEEFWTALVSKFVNIDVWNFRTFVITHFIPLFRAYVNGSDESGWEHVAGESASPTVLLLRTSLSALSSSPSSMWWISYHLVWK